MWGVFVSGLCLHHIIEPHIEVPASLQAAACEVDEFEKQDSPRVTLEVTFTSADGV